MRPTGGRFPAGSTLAGAMAYLGGANLLAFGAGIVRQKLFAVYLGPQGLGVVGIAASLFEFLANVARLGAAAGVVREMARHLSEAARATAARLFLDTRRVLLLFGAVVGALALALPSRLLADVLGGIVPFWCLVAICLSVPAQSWATLNESAMNAFGAVRRLVVGKAVIIVVSLGLTIGLVTRFGIVGGLLQIPAGVLVALIVSHVLLRNLFRPGSESPGSVSPTAARQAVKAVLVVGVAQVVHHAAITANLFAFRAVVARELGLDENGLYQGVMGLSRQYSNTIGAAIFVYLYPRLAAATSDRRKFAEDVSRSLAFVLSTTVPVCIGLLVVRDWVVALAFSPQFKPIIALMAYSLPGDVVVCLLTVLRVAFLARPRATAYLVLGLASEAVSLLVFLAALSWRGLEGAVLSYLVSSILLLPVHVLPLWRNGLLRLPKRLLYQGLMAIGIVGLAAALPAAAGASIGIGIVAILVWLACWRRELWAGATS